MTRGRRQPQTFLAARNSRIVDGRRIMPVVFQQETTDLAAPHRLPDREWHDVARRWAHRQTRGRAVRLGGFGGLKQGRPPRSVLPYVADAGERAAHYSWRQGCRED